LKEERPTESFPVKLMLAPSTGEGLNSERAPSSAQRGTRRGRAPGVLRPNRCPSSPREMGAMVRSRIDGKREDLRFMDSKK
jgi:hypothetical protein